MMKIYALIFYAIAFFGPLSAENSPAVIVIFGATGDLTSKKLIPALDHLSENNIVVGVARRELTHEEFRKQVKASDTFGKRVFYHPLAFDHSEGYEGLKSFLTQIDEKHGTKGNRLFYLATQSSYFLPIIKELKEHGLIYPKASEQWSRVIIEKPFGVDLNSAIALQEDISKHLDESQIYRIDHYLGKEGVQNLLKLRFENKLFEPIWNHNNIENVQITLSEELGIGTRGNFWEETGALRDLFQNHLMQILAILAMEAPSHQEKIKALESIRPFPQVVRGQYGSGNSQGSPVIGYRQEQNVNPNSNVETFLAAKIFIDNERWRGVPFYMRAGKRLAKQAVEIVVNFKDKTVLFVQIQPKIEVIFKPLGIHQESSPTYDAYEKLLNDALQGDKSLFVEADEQFAAWKVLTPVLDHWKENEAKDFPNYTAGSWGPKVADQLLQEQGHHWVLLK